MYPVALRDEIRTWVLIQGKSQRAAARHFGLSRNTVAKLLVEEPAARVFVSISVRHRPRRLCVMPLLPHIQHWLQENEWLERWAPKQCWTAHRMWGELRKLGIPIGEIDRAPLRAGAAHVVEARLRSARLCSLESEQSLTLAKRPSSWMVS